MNCFIYVFAQSCSEKNEVKKKLRDIETAFAFSIEKARKKNNLMYRVENNFIEGKCAST